MDKLKRVFVYCGVSKEEYESVKKDAYISNFRVWKELHWLIVLAYALLSVERIVNFGFDKIVTIRLIVAVYAFFVALLFRYKIKEDSLEGQLIIYLTMIVLLVGSFLMAFEPKEMMAVTFTVMLVLLPMFMIDRPFYMAIVLAIASGIYIYHAFLFRTGYALRGDVTNMIAYGLLGIIINTFYNSIRVREFLLTKKTNDNIKKQQESLEETNQLNEALRKMSESLIEVLGDVVESRDSDSGDHIQRVKGYTYILAKRVMQDLPEYGLDSYKVNMMTFASALHDVGKISIPDSILLKPGRLTKEEFEIMKTHSESGCNILMKMKDSWSKEYLDMGLAICRSHHEKWDGKGYPQGLKGDQIPIEAQIVSIADIFDALTTKRPYKDALPPEKALDMIFGGECGAFSEKIMSCFRKCSAEFEEYLRNPDSLQMPGYKFEIVSKGSKGFVIGLHDEERTLNENLRLSEELSVISSLSEKFCYVCYVNMEKNEVYRFKADEEFTRILDSFGPGLKSYERFDKLLNTIIVPEDYEIFRVATERSKALGKLLKKGHMSVVFRTNLEDGIHHSKLRMSIDPNDSNAVIIGILNIDEEYNREMETMKLQQALEESRKQLENSGKISE